MGILSLGWGRFQLDFAQAAPPAPCRSPPSVPDRRRRDVDNLGKAVLDLLTAHQVIEDDANVMSLTSRDTEVAQRGLQVAVVGGPSRRRAAGDDLM